jgi:hypothetical protein
MGTTPTSSGITTESFQHHKLSIGHHESSLQHHETRFPHYGMSIYITAI